MFSATCLKDSGMFSATCLKDGPEFEQHGSTRYARNLKISIRHMRTIGILTVCKTHKACRVHGLELIKGSGHEIRVQGLALRIDGFTSELANLKDVEIGFANQSRPWVGTWIKDLPKNSNLSELAPKFLFPEAAAS